MRKKIFAVDIHSDRVALTRSLGEFRGVRLSEVEYNELGSVTTVLLHCNNKHFRNARQLRCVGSLDAEAKEISPQTSLFITSELDVTCSLFINVHTYTRKKKGMKLLERVN